MREWHGKELVGKKERDGWQQEEEEEEDPCEVEGEKCL